VLEQRSLLAPECDVPRPQCMRALTACGA
jgi:hypothetical protein